MEKVYLIIFAISVLFASNGLSQDLTSGQKNDVLVSNSTKKSCMVVPMMDKMFLSNVSHEIGKYNSMNFREVRSFFIDKIIETAILSGEESWSMTPATDANDTIVRYMHMALGYDYEPIKVQQKEEESKIQSAWKKLQAKTQENSGNENGAYLDKGEIKQFYDGKERFMNAKADSAFVFGNLLQDSEFDYVLFINELDLNKPRPDEAHNSKERILKLHFTLYSAQGKRLYGNASFATFDESELDIYSIVNNALFSAINRMIAECTSHLVNVSQ